MDNVSELLPQLSHNLGTRNCFKLQFFRRQSPLRTNTTKRLFLDLDMLDIFLCCDTIRVASSAVSREEINSNGFCFINLHSSTAYHNSTKTPLEKLILNNSIFIARLKYFSLLSCSHPQLLVIIVHFTTNTDERRAAHVKMCKASTKEEWKIFFFHFFFFHKKNASSKLFFTTSVSDTDSGRAMTERGIAFR